jgi:hypothetical protein
MSVLVMLVLLRWSAVGAEPPGWAVLDMQTRQAAGNRRRLSAGWSAAAGRSRTRPAPFNPAGIRAYQKAGCTEEGRRRQAVLHDGRWYDEVLMSILDHEWTARQPPGR